MFTSRIFSHLGLAQKFVKSIPLGYKRVDIVTDTYQEFSIKNIESENSGEPSKVLVKSKMPRDFQSFLMNGEKKTRIAELISEYIDTHKAKTLNILRTRFVNIN